MSQRRSAQPRSARVIFYTRVSTEEQRDSGLGLDAQRASLAAEADRRGWTDVVWIADEGFSAKDLRRPGIAQALELLERGQASTLAVAKLDRLSRSLFDFAGLMERSRREGWALVGLDLGVDTSTPQGEMMAHILATFAQFERRLIALRTKEALAIKRAQGVRLGRPRRIPDEVVARILDEWAQGRYLREIAEGLDRDGVPTVKGGPWRSSTVQRVLQGALLDAEAAALRRQMAGLPEAVEAMTTSLGEP